MKKIDLKKIALKNLQSGDLVKIKGKVFTFRDTTCQQFFNNSQEIINLKNSFIFFCGPSPTPKGKIIGSCGPTTTSRMEKYLEQFLQKGVKGFLGKGEISLTAMRILKKKGAVYFSVTGGVGALLACKIKSAKIKALQELGPEAIYEFELKDFPAVVEI